MSRELIPMELRKNKRREVEIDKHEDGEVIVSCYINDVLIFSYRGDESKTNEIAEDFLSHARFTDWFVF